MFLDEENTFSKSMGIAAVQSWGGRRSVADPDPHLKSPPGSGSGSVWTDADPDPGGKKA